MNKSIQMYMNDREEFLRAVAEKLLADERFTAAWLTGSYAREEQDGLSDIDITVVVAERHSQTLCARPAMVSAQTARERYELFGSFGPLALLHENNYNAPEGGTFTFTAYGPGAIMVDWILRPLTGAQRPAASRLLFEKVHIPVQSPPEPESQKQRADEASEITAFFWMMAAVTVKYIYRGDNVMVNTWLEQLTKLVSEVERRIGAQPWQYRRGSQTSLSVTAGEQIAALRHLCERMESLKQEVLDLGGHVPEAPMTTIETLIRIAQEEIGI